jgi:hypothetical protein
MIENPFEPDIKYVYDCIIIIFINLYIERLKYMLILILQELMADKDEGLRLRKYDTE